MLSHIRRIVALGTLLAGAAAIASASELDGILVPCGKGMCPWVKTKAAPPEGWVEDKEWTERYQAVFFFENDDHSPEKPLIYVRSHLGEAKVSLDAYVEGAQSSWKSSHKRSKIEPEADVTRDGKPTFKVFLYKNPDVKEQAFELTAFTKDTDPSHGNATYFQQAVLVAPTMAALDAARPAFKALLGRL